jgi:hypothetical protein
MILLNGWKPGAELGAASRRLAGRRNADHRDPDGRRWLLHGARGQAEIVEVPELAVVRDDGALQRGIEDVENLVVAGARLVGPRPTFSISLGIPGRRSDLEPAAGEMVEHADLFDQLPRRVIGRHHAQRSQPQSLGPRCNCWR